MCKKIIFARKYLHHIKLMFLYLNILEILIVLIFRVLKRTMHIIFYFILFMLLKIMILVFKMATVHGKQYLSRRVDTGGHRWTQGVMDTVKDTTEAHLWR